MSLIGSKYNFKVSNFKNELEREKEMYEKKLIQNENQLMKDKIEMFQTMLNKK